MVASTLKSTKDLIDRARVRKIVDRETDRLNEYSGHSSVMYERAKVHMVNGVPSSYQVRDPWPIYMTTARVEDLGRRWR